MEITLTRHQEQLIRLPWQYTDIRHFFLVGGYGCLPKGSLIDTPLGKEPIERFRGGEVISDRGVAEASPSFYSGEKDIIHIETRNHSIDVSEEHILMGDGKWLIASGVRRGDMIKTEDGFEKVLLCYRRASEPCFDIQVEYPYQNYLSGGVFNHNCGKSFSDVMLIITLASKYPKLKAGGMFGVSSLSGVLFTTTIANTVNALCSEARIPYRIDKKDNIMHVGSSQFKIFNLEDYVSIAGYNFASVILDELDELPQAKALGAYKACRERCRVTLPDGREPFMVTTTTAQGKRGIYKIIQDLKREIGDDGSPTRVCVIHGRTKDNIFNDPSYYKDLYRAYDENERRAFLDGEFVALDTGRVYPKYDVDKNDEETIAPFDDEEIYIGQDLNLGFSCAVAVVVREGVIHVVKAYQFDDIWKAPETFREDFPYNPIQWFPDSSSKDIFSLQGFKQEIMKKNIRTRISTANPAIIVRTAMVNIMFRMGRLMIGKNKSTAHLREGLDMRGFDKNGNPEKGQGADAYDHMTDALEYVTFRLIFDKQEFSDIRSIRMAGNHPIRDTKEAV